MNYCTISRFGAMGSLFSMLFRPLILLGDALKPIMLMAISTRDYSAAPVDPEIAQDELVAGARIITVVLYKKSLDVSGWDAADTAAWEALRDAGDIHILAPARGSLPEASPTYAPGYGTTNQVLLYRTLDVNFVHATTGNKSLDFWSTIERASGQWAAMYVFEDLKALLYLNDDLSVIPMSFNAVPYSKSDDTGDIREMKAQANVRYTPQPREIDLSGSASLFRVD